MSDRLRMEDDADDAEAGADRSNEVVQSLDSCQSKQPK